jgi:hypothetical protein
MGEGMPAEIRDGSSRTSARMTRSPRSWMVGSLAYAQMDDLEGSQRAGLAVVVAEVV